MRALCVNSARQIEDPPDLGERKSQALGLQDEEDTVHVGLGIQAVVGPRPPGRANQPQLFPVTERLRRDAALSRQLPDRERLSIHLSPRHKDKPSPRGKDQLLFPAPKQVPARPRMC